MFCMGDLKLGHKYLMTIEVSYFISQSYREYVTWVWDFFGTEGISSSSFNTYWYITVVRTLL